MSKPIIIYNRDDFQINKIFKLFIDFYPDVILIDNYDIYDENSFSKLNIYLAELKEKYSDLRLLFFVDSSNKQLNDFLEYSNAKNYRRNFVFFNAHDYASTLELYVKFNSIIKGTTVFGWLVGREDSEGTLITDDKLSDILSSWVMLLSSGALSFQTDYDIFFEQQNWRDKENHLLMLKSKTIISNLYMDTFLSIQYHLRELIKSNNEEINTSEYFYLSNFYESEIDNEEKFVIDHEFYPTYKKFREFKNLDELEEKLKDLLLNFEREQITSKVSSYAKEKSIEYKNLFERIKEDSLNQLKDSIKGNFLDEDKFSFSKISNYIKNTIHNLKKNIREPFELSSSTLFTSILGIVESDAKSILNIRKEIKAWKSNKKKKEFGIYATISFAFLFILEIIGLYSLSIDIGLNLLLILFSMSLLGSLFFWWRRYGLGLQKLTRLLNSKIKSLNNKIISGINKFLDVEPFRTNQFLQKHWERKLYSYLSLESKVLENGMKNFNRNLNILNKDMDLIVKGLEDNSNYNCVDRGRVYREIIFNNIRYYLENKFSNIDALQEQILNSLIKLSKETTLLEQNYKFANFDPNNLSKQAFPVDFKFFANDPISNGKFVLKPENYKLENVNLDKTINLKSNNSLLYGESYFVELS